MKRFFGYFLLCGFILLLPLAGEESIELSEPVNPDGLYVGKENIYIVQRTDIFRYSRNNYKPLGKFGRKGEGPGEFKGRVDYINIRPEGLLISSRDKISHFTRNGTFIMEIKSKSSRAYRYISIGDHFVGESVSFKEKTLLLTINLYSSSLEKIRLLFEKEAGYQRGGKIKFFYSAFDFGANSEKIFLIGRNDFVVDVYNSKGEELPQIKFETKKKPVQNTHIQQVHDYLKSNPETKAQYLRIKDRLDFPSHFPAIRSIHVDDDYVYLQTHEKEKGDTKFYVVDMEGKLKRKIMVLLKDANILESFPFTIKDATLFQLIENPDTEIWELHITPLEIK